MGLASLLSAAPAAAAGDLRREIDRAWPLSGATRIELHVGVGEVEVIGEDRHDVAVEIRLAEWGDDRRSFERWAGRYDATARRRGDRLRVDVRGPRFLLREDVDIAVTVRVPRALPLEVDMAIGSLAVRGVQRPLELKLGIGEVDLDMPQAGVRDVKVALGIGEASLEAQGRRRMETATVFGSGLRWSEGRGDVPVSVRLGVGEVAVVLR